MQPTRYQVAKRAIADVYKNINPTYLSKQARDELGIQDDSFVYGEIDPQSLINLIEIARPQKEDIFYDLGAGSGRAAMTAALCFPFSKVVGLEFLQPLTLLAQNQWATLQANTQLDKTSVEFISGDYFETDFSEANIIFFNATACRDEKWEKMLSKFEAMPVGTRFILTTHRLPSPQFEASYEGLQLMSWGMNSTYVYRKIK